MRHSIPMMVRMLAASQIDAPAAPSRVVVSDTLRRAIEIRIGALEREQAADATEFERIDERASVLVYGMLERQKRLRQFREILLHRRAA